jgi:hypothetical protein
VRNRSCQLAILLLLSSTAYAQEDDEQSADVAPAQSPRGPGAYVGLGIGPAVHVQTWPTQFRVEEEIGYFFDGRPEGFFIAFTASQAFGGDFYTFVFAGRFGYFFNFYRRDFTFQIGPVGAVPGFAMAPITNNVNAHFHFALGLQARLLLMEEKLAIYVRPLEFEFGIGSLIGIRYVLTAGAQFAF